MYFHHGRTMLNGWWRFRGADLGPRIRVSGRPRVVVHGTMRIADRVQIYSTLARSEFVAGSGATLEIGSRTLVNFGTSVVATGRVSIGAHCHIGPHCMIMDNPFHELDPDRRLEVPQPRPIVIEDNVWLGARVIVMPGVTIGRDSVVGAGGVVTKDVPPRTLVAGVPAREVRRL
jgi:maltose O-acetyltransferase